MVLAHAGWDFFCDKAIAVAQAFPQVYLEPSWCRFFSIGAMISALGAGRVTFGSDLAPNVPIMLETFRAVGLGKEHEDMVLGGTARQFYQLNL